MALCQRPLAVQLEDHHPETKVQRDSGLGLRVQGLGFRVEGANGLLEDSSGYAGTTGDNKAISSSTLWQSQFNLKAPKRYQGLCP